MVEWKKLGEVCEILDSQRKPVSKGKRVQGTFPYYGANGIQDYVDKYIFDGTFLLLGEDGSVKNEDNTPVLHWATGKIWVNNHAHILKECDGYILRYIYYSLQCVDVSDIVRGVPPKISQANMRNILIPIPSLSEQERIVGILDTFTASIDNIKAQIEQRRKQYEHYRNTLLTFNKDDDSVEWKTLGEVAYYPQEKISASKLNKTNYVSVENLLQNKAGKVYSSCCPQEGNWKKYEIGDILIGNIRPNLRKIWLANIIGGTNGDVLTIRINDTYKHNISTNFLYYILSSEDFFLYDIQNAKGAKMPRGDKKVVLDYPIPIPSIQEQQRIVSILDTFEASINNLEAQLEQRQKQYEYYREKLLTFE